MSEVVEAGTELNKVSKPRHSVKVKTDFEREDKLYKLAERYVKSSILPPHFMGNPANVWMGLKMAEGLGVEPISLMNEIYFIPDRHTNGQKASIHTKFAIALANERVFSRPIDYEFKEEECSRTIQGKPFTKDTLVRAFATLNSGTKVSGPWVSYAEILQSGLIHQKNGGLKKPWVFNKRSMLMYKAAAFLIKLSVPGVVLGMDLHSDAAPASSAPKQIESGDVKQKIENLLEVEEVKS